MKTHLTKKGMTYTIDVVLAMIVVGILLVLVFNKNIEEQENLLNKLQLIRTGSDIVNVLSEEGTLDTLDFTKIDARMQAMLPASYNMQLRLEGNFPSGILVIETNSSSNEQKFIASGKRIVAIEYANQIYFAEAHYEVWS